MKDKLRYSFYVLTHPFDGFYDLKHENRGSLLLATVYILLWVISNVLVHEVTSFLYNETGLQLVSIQTEFNKVLIITLLFCIGNWSITTLMEGEGRFRDIYMVFGYSTLPLSLINIPLAFLSQSFTYAESAYYGILTVLAGIWFFFLLFTGIMTVHQYTVTKMLITSVLTVIAMLALAFIYLLFFHLISEFVMYVTAIWQELSCRVGPMLEREVTMKKGMCLAAWSVVAALLLSLCGCGVSNRVDDRYRESVPVFDFCYASQPTAGTDTAVLPASYKQAAENNWLRLYLDESTGGVAVADRRSGKVWSSIPSDLDKDTVATVDMQELIRSVLRVDYYDGDTLKSLYSYKNCVNEGGLTTEKTDDGVRLIFSLSLSKATYDDLPKKLSAERYTRFFGDTSALTGTEKSRLEKYFTWDDAAQVWVLGAETAAMVRSLPGILKKVGYTADDLKADSESMGFAYNPSSSVYFDVTVDYRLQNDSLLVDVPLSALKYNPDYPPSNLQLNEFLLHSDQKGNGYMLIPDGSGALVDFSAGAHDTGTQEIALYGNDKTLSNQEKTSLEIGTVMPVYGIREGDNGVLAIIEDGDVMAKITAQKANTRSTYNVVGTRFILSDRTNAMIGDGSVNTTVPVSQNEIYGGSLRTRYVLLAGGGTYSDMAACYKAYLMQRDGLKLTGIAAQPELYLETIGAITRTEEVLGFQYEGTKALTTFKQAQEILKLYTDAGVSSVQMISTGALKGGVDNYSLNRNDLLRTLGGEKDFAALSEAVEAQNGTLYLGVNALTVPRESGHINRNARSARTLDKSLA